MAFTSFPIPSTTDIIGKMTAAIVASAGAERAAFIAAIAEALAEMTEADADFVATGLEAVSSTARDSLLDVLVAAAATGEVVIKAAAGIDGEAVTDLTGDEAIILRVFNDDQDVVVGDAALTFPIPPELNGFNLTSASAVVDTAGTTGNLDIQIRNVTQTADMLTTKIRVETGETKSSTGVTGVPDAANDDVATHDIIAIDIDSTQTTEPLGLTVYLSFALP